MGRISYLTLLVSRVNNMLQRLTSLAIIVILALCSSSQCEAALGFDLSVASDQTDWECLATNDATFGIVRLYRNLGQIDKNAAKSIIAANTALDNIDGYMFPCVTQSPYSIANNITCDDAATQVKHTLQYLAEEGIWVNNSTLSPQPFFPILTTLGRIWLDIEDEVPSKYYSPTIADNTAFMSDIVAALTSYGIEVGIYTTKTYWANVMGNQYGYGGRKLWYPHYDAVNNMDFASTVLPFAGFTSVYIKQTGGDVGLCGLSQVDSNYMPDNA